MHNNQEYIFYPRKKTDYTIAALFGLGIISYAGCAVVLAIASGYMLWTILFAFIAVALIGLTIYFVKRGNSHKVYFYDMGITVNTTINDHINWHEIAQIYNFIGTHKTLIIFAKRLITLAEFNAIVNDKIGKDFEEFGIFFDATTLDMSKITPFLPADLKTQTVRYNKKLNKCGYVRQPNQP